MVFSGLYPINTADYEHLKANLAKLQLLWDFFRKDTRLIRGDRKFWLIELAPASNALSGETRTSKEPINRNPNARRRPS